MSRESLKLIKGALYRAYRTTSVAKIETNEIVPECKPTYVMRLLPRLKSSSRNRLLKGASLSSKAQFRAF